MPDYDKFGRPIEVKEINQDELIGYIMRVAAAERLEYDELKAVLDAEEQFLKEKGIAYDSDTEER